MIKIIVKIKNLVQKIASLFAQNGEKGFATIGELLATISLATVVIGGVSVSAQDLLKEATDTQKIANLRQISAAIEICYSDSQNYPQVDFNGLISGLVENDCLASLPSHSEQYNYEAFNDGSSYILRTTLENPDSAYFENSLNGNLEGVNCDKPYYCIKM